MTRWIVVWGVLVLTFTLLLNVPAAFVVRQLDWPPGWQPQMVSGSLWDGQMAQLGALGPVEWSVRPWAREIHVDAAFQQRIWALSLHGWPWDWQARLAPGVVSAAPAGSFVLAGQWGGGLNVSGAGRACRSSEGELRGTDLALLTPWVVSLGNTDIRLECREGLKLLATLYLKDEHRFDVEADWDRKRVKVDGRVEPTAAATPLLVQARWLSPGQQSFSKTLGRP